MIFIYLLLVDSLPMNAPFVHFLEDELDNIFLKLNEEQQENVLRHLQSKDIDEAFYNIRRKGNEGFHSFAQILRKQVIKFLYFFKYLSLICEYEPHLLNPD